MKVLHISKYYHPYIGGVEGICKYIVDGLGPDNVAVVCFNEFNKNVEEYVDGVKVYRVSSQLNIASQALSIHYKRILKKAITEFQPDIIHFHWANPFPAAVLLTVLPKHVKLVIHWHMDIIKQKNIYRIIKPVETALLKRADRICVTSPQYRDHSKPLQPFLDKITVVPNACDVRNLIPQEGDAEKIAALKQKWGNKKIVFFVGRHILYKGLSYLIDAENYIKEDCVLIIGGDGPLTDEIKASCHSDRVHFVGRLTSDELRCYHHAADVFAFPSITKNEAFGVALAEALYCETPAVTFTIPGSGVNWVCLNEITGIEVPNKDVKSFAAAVDRLLSDDDLRTKYGMAGKKRVLDNFTIPILSENMNEVYQQLLK